MGSGWLLSAVCLDGILPAVAGRVRCSGAGYVYRILGRAVGRATLFDKPGDYAAFENVLREADEKTGLRPIGFAVTPNHWHGVVRPECDGQLSEWAQWLTGTHVRRWHAHHCTVGTGPLYQGRFKSFPVQTDDHSFTHCRYVEHNPLRATSSVGWKSISGTVATPRASRG